jgi:hypothetical protein
MEVGAGSGVTHMTIYPLALGALQRPLLLPWQAGERHPQMYGPGVSWMGESSVTHPREDRPDSRVELSLPNSRHSFLIVIGALGRGLVGHHPANYP